MKQKINKKLFKLIFDKIEFFTRSNYIYNYSMKIFFFVWL